LIASCFVWLLFARVDLRTFQPVCSVHAVSLAGYDLP